MLTPVDAFAASPWRDEILTEVLRFGRARPGLTMVAAFDWHTLELTGLVRMNTPRPPEGAGADAILAARLGPTLAAIAHFAAPSRPEGVARDGVPPTHTLVTIVCREGEPVASPAEEQFVRAWRASADTTSARHGAVYVVTPNGWACLQGGSGAEPCLEIGDDSYACDPDVIDLLPLVDPDELEADPAVQAAEAVLAEVFATDFDTIAAPEAGECLACYVTRMVGQFDCDGTWRFVDHYRATLAPRASALERRPWRRDGECDCAVYELGYDLAEHVEEPVGHAEAGGVPVVIHYEWPWPDPPTCAGVRRGSVKPCDVWEPLVNLQ